MLTPQEVQERSFVKAVFGGYDMAAVDVFLDQLSGDYAALYKENAVLKSKMKLLVETVEEYRSVDDQMRKALLTAQRMAEETKRTAEEEAKNILESARKKAEQEIKHIQDQVALEERRLEYAKKETARAISLLRSVYEKQLAMLDQIPDMDIKGNAEKEEQISDAARDIEDSLRNRFAEPDELPFMAEEASFTAEAARDLDEDNKQDKAQVPEEETLSLDIKLGEDIPELDDSAVERDPYDTGDIAGDLPKYDFGDLQFGSKYSVIGKQKEKK